MKKIIILCFFALSVAAVSFAQIYKGDADTKNGTVEFLLHYIEYSGYRYLFYIDGVSVFLDEDGMGKLVTALDKFAEWEEIAQSERITLTKTIDSITFGSFYYDRTFFKEPLTLYFVFTGGPLKTPSPDSADAGTGGINDINGVDGVSGALDEFTGGAGIDIDTGGNIGEAGGVPSGADAGEASTYTLFVDTTLERITPFRLSSKTVHEALEAITPEKLSEARAAYEHQKALEAMFR